MRWKGRRLLYHLYLYIIEYGYPMDVKSFQIYSIYLRRCTKKSQIIVDKYDIRLQHSCSKQEYDIIWTEGLGNSSKTPVTQQTIKCL